MTSQDSAIASGDSAISAHRGGLGWGLLGVLAFSLTVPMTRVAVGGLSPLVIGAGRAVVAAALAAVALRWARQPLPNRRQWRRLAVVAAGVVAGFPLLTSYALQHTPASHGAVVIALLPAATAVVAALRGHERPPRSFWLLALLGAVAAVVFAAAQGQGAGGVGGLGGLHAADALLLGAVLAAAIGYAEGGLLARELGPWQTVSWALLGSAPAMAAVTAWDLVSRPPNATPQQWGAFAYLACVSMFLGFFAWYRGLAIGPMTQVSQVQLVQPVLTIGWAALLLHEPIGAATLLGGAAVVGCSALAVRTRLRRPAARP